jgi:glyoxylate reductase
VGRIFTPIIGIEQEHGEKLSHVFSGKGCIPMKQKILVTRLIPEQGLAMLRERYDMTVNPCDRVMTRQEMLDSMAGKKALLPLLTDPVDGALMDAAGGELKVISNYAVGFNNIDIKAATERGIVVTNTPGVLTETTADFAFALLLAIARRVPESDRFTRAGEFHGWGPMLLLGDDVHGKTLGIVGMGRIGRAMARRAAGFSMSILYHSSNPLEKEEEQHLNARCVPFEELLQRSDFVSIHVPLTEKTRHLFGKKELAMMKEGSYLINTSRGPVVHEEALAEALAEALKKGIPLKGAALDVYEHEPAIHPALMELENVIIAPHTASATIETRTRMSVIAAENLIAAMEGRKPPFVVNPEVLE